MNEIEKRREEISLKFLEMGLSLTKEGETISDYQIAQAGNFMVLLAGIILNDEDTFEFSEVCSLFSLKKISDNIGENVDGETIQQMLKDMFNIDKNDDEVDDEESYDY
jgi:hypothetical protein